MGLDSRCLVVNAESPGDIFVSLDFDYVVARIIQVHLRLFVAGALVQHGRLLDERRARSSKAMSFFLPFKPRKDHTEMSFALIFQRLYFGWSSLERYLMPPENNVQPVFVFSSDLRPERFNIEPFRRAELSHGDREMEDMPHKYFR